MKGVVAFLFVLLVGATATAQAPWLQRPDSLKKVLENTTDDDLRLELVGTLFVRYLWSSPDSASPYAQQYMLLAQQKKSDKFLSNAYFNYQFLAQLTGNFPQALGYGFKGLSIAERTKNFLTISSALRAISDAYLAQGDTERSIQYSQKAIDILKKNYSLPAEQPSQANDTTDLYASILYNTCKAYTKVGQPDSILKYIKIVEWIWGHKWTTPKKRWPTIPLTYGNVNYILGNYTTANTYYHEGIVAAKYWDAGFDLMENLYGLALSHKKMNQWDSAIYYAREVLDVSKTAQNPIVKMEALTLLSNTFKVINNIDSSAKYFELTLAAKDSMFNQSRIVEMQNSTFNEQLRQQEIKEAEGERTNRYRLYAFAGGLTALIVISLVLYRNMRIKQKANREIEKAYGELKSAQSQLIHAEKMASLGELTAGIAHEIQNPLNFVNNFSEVNSELMAELEEEATKGNLQEVKAIAKSIKENEQKIVHHGKRADAIVKGMLQHSRSSTGIREPTNINALAEEYLRLAYHGFKAKDKSFSATTKTDFDPNVGDMDIIPQEIGRVILNLISNGFYAVTEKKKQQPDLEPTVTVSTKKTGNKILVSVKDNGNGIPQHLLNKIFQPFFTTKPAGEGTGLGLSLSYDIVKAHGGELKVNTKEGEGAEFIIELPLSEK